MSFPKNKTITSEDSKSNSQKSRALSLTPRVRKISQARSNQ